MKNSELYLAAKQLQALWNEAEENEGIDWDTFTPALEYLMEVIEEMENE